MSPSTRTPIENVDADRTALTHALVDPTLNRTCSTLRANWLRITELLSNWGGLKWRETRIDSAEFFSGLRVLHPPIELEFESVMQLFSQLDQTSRVELRVLDTLLKPGGLYEGAAPMARLKRPSRGSSSLTSSTSAFSLRRAPSAPQLCIGSPHRPPAPRSLPSVTLGTSGSVTSLTALPPILPPPSLGPPPPDSIDDEEELNSGGRGARSSTSLTVLDTTTTATRRLRGTWSASSLPAARYPLPVAPTERMRDEMSSLIFHPGPPDSVLQAKAKAEEDRLKALRRIKYAPGPKTLRISGIKCDDLPDADKGMGAGTSDPYLKFQLVTDRGEAITARTQTLMNAPRDVEFDDVLEMQVPMSLLKGFSKGKLIVQVCVRACVRGAARCAVVVHDHRI